MPKRLEAILNRIRIERRQISHSYLVSKDKLALCWACGVTSNVKRILIEFREYHHFRTKNNLSKDIAVSFNSHP